MKIPRLDEDLDLFAAISQALLLETCRSLEVFLLLFFQREVQLLSMSYFLMQKEQDCDTLY